MSNKYNLLNINIMFYILYNKKKWIIQNHLQLKM